MERLYKREDYLNKIRGFYDDTMIKVITGIRRCGKSYLLKTVIEELKDKGVKDKDIIYIELDRKEYKDVKTPKELEKIIDDLIKDNHFKYLFIDEVENVSFIINEVETPVSGLEESESFSVQSIIFNEYYI